MYGPRESEKGCILLLWMLVQSFKIFSHLSGVGVWCFFFLGPTRLCQGGCVVELWASCQGRFGRCSNIVIWSCLIWCIWSERNARNLKDVKNSFSIWSFYSLNLYLSKWMLLLYSILPICPRCVTVILVVLNFGVPVYMDYAPFVFNHWNIYL